MLNTAKLFFKLSTLIIILISTIFILTGFSGVAITSNGSITTINSSDFELIKSETVGSRSSDGTYKITGKIRQKVEGSYTGIAPSFILLDKYGKKVRETTGLSSSNYEGNNVWSFTVYGNDADGVVVNYQMNYCYGY